MKRLIVTVFCLFNIKFIASSQVSVSYSRSPSSYFNKFQVYIDNKTDPDSALYCLKILSSINSYSTTFRMLMHDIFAQNFAPTDSMDNNTAKSRTNKEKRLFSQKILRMVMEDTNQLLRNTLHPLHIVVQAQEAKGSPAELRKLTEKFIQTELTGNQFFANKTIRYGLMIHQLILKEPSLQPLASKLITVIYDHLKQNQVSINESSLGSELDKRAWYRYMFAATNYLLSLSEKDVDAEKVYLKTAFNFSPDLTDKDHRSAYFYDQFFLFPEGKDSFKDDYINAAMNTDVKADVQSMILNIALVEPEFKQRLKEFYISNITNSVEFDKYWHDAINSNAVAAPEISLNQLNKKLFSSKKLSGKWIMIDFWGTWCGPCRREHPTLQKFYNSIVLNNPETLSLLTIACNDKETAVVDYLKENRFSFPVAMSDNIIEHSYSVQGYPSKMLITPERKFIKIPFGVDWIAFVIAYTNLD